jgi:hypothetical protein
VTTAPTAPTTTGRPSVALSDPRDREQTQLTALAQRLLDDALARDPDAHGYPAEFVVLASGETIVLEVHGQSSATGHGKQGLRPDRAALLRRLDAAGFAVRLVFVEGVESRREAWLHDLPAAVPISLGLDGDPDSRRYGWPAKQLEKTRGPLVVPARVTERRLRAQETLA